VRDARAQGKIYGFDTVEHPAMNPEQAWFNMIEQQIRPWYVHSSGVLDVLSKVNRRSFVPEAYLDLSFSDLEIALPCGQHMLSPSVQARMLQEIALQPHERVLEIGSGSGYLTALLAHCAKHVVTLEIEADLVQLTRSNLARSGVGNADCFHVDASIDAPVKGQFDVIVLSGSLAQIPKNLWQLLTIGGRMIGPIGRDPLMDFTMITRVDATNSTSRALWQTMITPLRNFTQPDSFVF
jgi:protein-L-isoaspartate(D-aspartate) O-methyltransferase